MASLEATVAQPTPTISGTIGTLAIPALDRVVPIVSVGWRVDEIDGAQVAVWETVSGAAGHHRGSAPLGGEGNCVLSGHSSGEHGGVFDGLWDLQQGDPVYVTDKAGQVYSYVVGSVTKVRDMGVSLEERLVHAEAMDPTDDARLTLITCWPGWAYTHRVIVVARPAGSD
ncbi:MAG: sortase [Anaerolineae bacterium]